MGGCLRFEMQDSEIRFVATATVCPFPAKELFCLEVVIFFEPANVYYMNRTSACINLNKKLYHKPSKDYLHEAVIIYFIVMIINLLSETAHTSCQKNSKI